MRSQLAALTLIFLPLALSAAEEDASQFELAPGADSLPVVRLSPQIRESDRGRSYYESIACTDLAQADVRSEQEKRWLEERKNSCLERYRVFSPRSFQ